MSEWQPLQDPSWAAVLFSAEKSSEKLKIQLRRLSHKITKFSTDPEKVVFRQIGLCFSRCACSNENKNWRFSVSKRVHFFFRNIMFMASDHDAEHEKNL